MKEIFKNKRNLEGEKSEEEKNTKKNKNAPIADINIPYNQTLSAIDTLEQPKATNYLKIPSGKVVDVGIIPSS